MNVLKGSAATALYGSRAQNGAIIITTKKGKARKGIGVSISSGYTMGKIDKSTFIEYQDQYGAGYSNYYYGPDGGPFEMEDIDGDGTLDEIVPTTEDGSYGQRFDANRNVYHWDSFVPESPNYMKKYGWEASNSTPVDFFETSHTFNNNVTLTGGDEKSTFRLSYTNFNTTGILPNSEQDKNTISFVGSNKLTDKFEATFAANYVNTKTTGRNSTGYGDNLMSQFRQWWQTNVSIEDQKSIYDQTGKNYTWNAANYHDPLTPIFWDNPYWTRYENYQSDVKDRIYGNFTLNYQVNDWLDVLGRVALDQYDDMREERRAVGSVPTSFGINRADESSGYQQYHRKYTELNYDFMMNFNKNVTEDLNLMGVLGATLRTQSLQTLQSSTNGGLVVPGLYSLDNSTLTPPLPVETLREKEVGGVFANASVGYLNQFYLDVTARNDWSSALPEKNNSYFYPSVALSWAFNEAVDAEWLNYGKFRVNYAEVGNDLAANNVFDSYSKIDNFGSGISFSVPNTKKNSDLKPERTSSYEVGIDLGMFNNRVYFDGSVYNQTTTDQLLPVEVSRSSGFTYKWVNAGEIANKGVELGLSGDIFKNRDGFNWNARINWSTNKSEVTKLDGDNQNFVLNSYQGGITSNATVGEAFGVLKGTGFVYAPDDAVTADGKSVAGQKVLTSSGYYAAQADQIIADPNPDWIAGITNTFSYKGLALSFLIDIQQGGDVYSLDMHYGQGTGLPANTIGNNDKGNPLRETVANGGGVRNNGVILQDDGTYVENVKGDDAVYARADYYGGAFYWGNSDRNPAELTVYDASYVKLRELSLTYTLPKELTQEFSEKVSLSFIGRNLWIIHKNVPYADPESGLGAGNSQGYLTGSYPTARTYGVKLDIAF